MLVLFVIPVAVLFGLGFVNPLFWVAGGVLVFLATGVRSRGRLGRGAPRYEDYREYRDRQHRWARRYRRSRQGEWDREADRDDHERDRREDRREQRHEERYEDRHPDRG